MVQIHMVQAMILVLEWWIPADFISQSEEHRILDLRFCEAVHTNHQTSLSSHGTSSLEQTPPELSVLQMK
jgi:hypothetical protein